MLRKHLPNIITLINLLAGCLAIVLLWQQEYLWACWLIAGAGLADLLDGMVARLLGVFSELGRELDSLADMVSFGFVPGLIYYQLISASASGEGLICWSAVPAFLVTLFSALRLARFNLDPRQTEGFLGLPTPASTLLAVGLLLIYVNDSFGWGDLVASRWLLYPLIVGVSVLLVAEVPLFSLKIKDLRWEGNQIRFIFVLSSALLLVILREVGLVAAILLYILLSLLFKFKIPHEISGGN